MSRTLKVSDIRKLKIEADEVLMVFMPKDATPEEFAAAKDTFAEVFYDRCSVIVVPHNYKIMTIQGQGQLA